MSRPYGHNQAIGGKVPNLAMTYDEHRIFISEVIDKYSLSLAELLPTNPNFIDQTISALASDKNGMSLLGMSQAHWLIDHCIENRDHDRLCELAEKRPKVPSNAPSVNSDEVLTTCLWLRSALFFQYLASGHKDQRLVMMSVQLLTACLEADPTCMKQAEATLSQAYGVDISCLKYT